MSGRVMIASWVVILASLVYLCLLFVVAHWGDHGGRRFIRRTWRTQIYALALAVYCTSWTFYGSVGLATRAGLDYLTIYIGPILLFVFGHPLLARVIRIAKAQNITSVADFVASRYGKSERVAALVSVISVVSAVPYTALQLKAVSSSLGAMLGGRDGTLDNLFGGDMALVVAVCLAGFAISFGTRQVDATQHQNGLVLAIAAESLLKLAAFLLVGGFVTYWMFDGFGDILRHFGDPHRAFAMMGPTSDPFSLGTLVLISAVASLLLPRQFQMCVVENRSVSDVKAAAWLFPLYLVAINIFVVPLALAGLQLFPGDGVDRDMTMLALPLHAGSGIVALIAYLGGLSAATAMVIVETIAVSVMVSNHIAMPLALRLRRFSSARHAGHSVPFGTFVVTTRRLAILALITLSYVYYRVAGANELASIGFLSFAAIAQIAPAFFIGLVWRRATAAGASAGLAIGLSVWAYTLLLPVLTAGTDNVLLTEGPFGITALRPTALFGVDLPQIAHGVLWSLALNALAYVVFSLVRPGTALDRLQANAFVGETRMPIAPTLRMFRVSVSVDELRGAVERFLGEERTRRSFAGFARARGIKLEGPADADIHLLRYAEHLLSSAIGAASSRLALSLVLRRRNLSPGAALRLLDDASAAIQHNRDLLQHALDHAQQGINVLDGQLRLLLWNQAFIELYDFPPELVRIGVGLEEIVRLNAERGAYGPGPIDDLVAARLDSLVRDSGPVRRKISTTHRVISTRSNPLPGGGLFITYTDVTEIVAEEEALERTNETLEQRVQERTEELTRLNEELTRAKQQADDANASKTRFLAAASHDILQPLNAARLYATSLVERSRDGQDAKLAGNVSASLDAVEEILTSLLDISRLESGALKPQWSVIKVDELFGQLALEFEPSARARGLNLRFVPVSLSIRSDRRLLRRLLQNLISNAIKYTPRGRVLVGARRRGTNLRLEVWDTGLGIPASQQRTIFSEFRRLPAGARTAQGLGLGLFIVERIATTLRTKIELDSELGRGSAFRIRLPITNAVARVRSADARVPAPAVALANLAVLAIDNEPAVLDGMRILLEAWGCRVETATSLADCTNRLDAGRPDVIVADFHLDDGDGLAAIEAVRVSLGSDVPAVLITADRSPALRDRASRTGVDVLNKPLKPAALRALLSRVRAARIAAE